MAFSFGLDFSKKKSTTEQRTQQDITRDRTTTSEAEKTGTKEERQQQDQVVELLGEEQRQQLESLVANLAGRATEGAGTQISDVAQLLLGNAQGAGAAAREGIEPIIAEARRTGERKLTEQETLLGAQSGSRLNTFVQQVAGEGSAALESQLAALQAQLETGARGEEREALLQTVQGLATGAQAGQAEAASVAQIADVLRGSLAKTTGTVVGETKTAEQARTEEILQEIAKAITTGTSTTKQKSAGFKLGF